MATTNFTLSTPTPRQLALQAPSPDDGPADRLNACIDHLEAMACIATTEDFSLWNAQLRDRYMFALCDKAKEVKRVLKALQTAEWAERIVDGRTKYDASRDFDNPYIPEEIKLAGGAA